FRARIGHQSRARQIQLDFAPEHSHRRRRVDVGNPARILGQVVCLLVALKRPAASESLLDRLPLAVAGGGRYTLRPNETIEGTNMKTTRMTGAFLLASCLAVLAGCEGYDRHSTPPTDLSEPPREVAARARVERVNLAEDLEHMAQLRQDYLDQLTKLEKV